MREKDVGSSLFGRSFRGEFSRRVGVMTRWCSRQSPSDDDDNRRPEATLLLQSWSHGGLTHILVQLGLCSRSSMDRKLLICRQPPGRACDIQETKQ